MDNNVKEPIVHQEVLDEIKRLGDGYEAAKKNYEDLNKAFKAAKDEIDSKTVDKTKLERIKEELVTRQEALDKKITENELKEKQLKDRIDQFELFIKRPNTAIEPNEKPIAVKEIEAHYLACQAGKGVFTSREAVKNSGYSEKDYKDYVKAFESYMLKGGDRSGFGLTPEEQKTLSVGIDLHGGVTVTPATGAAIMATIYETSPMRQLASVQTISTDSIEYLIDFDEAGAGWVSETQARPNTGTPDIDKLKIFVHEMYANPLATQQILEDSSINIESWLSEKVAERFARLEATAFITGDGIGKPKGILSYADGTTYKTIEQVEMGAAASLTADGFIRIKYALKEAYHNAGTWLMNRTTVRDAMLLKNGAGDYIWKEGITRDIPSTILNFPVRMASDMPVVAANALAVALADWRQAYQIVDRIGISVLRDPYSNKPYVEFYTRKRVGGLVKKTESIKLGYIHV